MKKYIIRTAIQVNPQRIIHPNTDEFWDYNWEWEFIETSYSDWLTYIWILDWIETIPVSVFDFKLEEKTELEINEILNTWYDWEVQVKDFIFTDNRPIEILDIKK